MDPSTEKQPAFSDRPIGTESVQANPLSTGTPTGYVPISSDERTMAMLAELLQLFSWIIGPLVIFLVKRDSPFVRFHALQAMLWQLVMVMLSIIFFVVVVAIAVAAPKSAGPSSPASVLFILSFYALFGLFSLANFVIAIYFAVKANAGAWASYPVIGSIARSILGLPAAAPNGMR
jgi:uncharacterized Tic20 family protein